MIRELQLQLLAEEMCEYWKIQKKIIVRIDEDHSILKEEDAGLCRYWLNPLEVFVLRAPTNQGTLYNFYHELRHVWQARWYKRVLRWWSHRPKLYNELYSFPQCNLEEDARKFGTQVVWLGVSWREAQGDLSQLAEFQRNINLADATKIRF